MSVVLSFLVGCSEDPNLYKDSTQPTNLRVENLLKQMTFEEKLEQMNLLPIGRSNNENNVQEKKLQTLSPLTGAYIFSSDDPAWANKIQKKAVEESRLGIPVLLGMDVIHGFRTIFPISLGQACSWNPDLVYDASRVAAKEAYLSGLRWTFSPMIDVARDSRWGRISESYGEDPYANSVFGVATVKGYQGENLSDKYSIAACMKHFAGYAYSQGGRDYYPTEVSDLSMWETVFPPYKACVDAGAATIMSSFNDLNGTPTTTSRELLTDILKVKWNFKGFVVSDWGSIQQILNQRFAADRLEAGAKALAAGTDMDMSDGIYTEYMAEALERGLVNMEMIDDAVRRILTVKFNLGLFENPYVEVVEERYLEPESIELAEKLAQESMVLLKNENSILPLKKSVKSIALVGVMADDSENIIGSWTCSGRPDDVVTVLDGLQNEYGKDVKINYVSGAELRDNSKLSMPALRSAISKSDVVVVALGESRRWSGENGSVASIALPAEQEQIVFEAKKLGKPIILLLSSGRPLELARLEPLADAIIQMWQPGTRGGNAVAGIISGRVNPEGRLAITFPYVTGQTPVYYNHRANARIAPQGNYSDVRTTPLYNFGDGLSYSNFEYSEITLSKSEISKGDIIKATVTVKNNSKVDGAETLFWFVDDPVASVSQPVKKLKYFEKAQIKAGEQREFTFEIDPVRDLSFVDSKGNVHTEAGEFYILVKDKRVKLVLI